MLWDLFHFASLLFKNSKVCPSCKRVICLSTIELQFACGLIFVVHKLKCKAMLSLGSFLVLSLGLTLWHILQTKMEHTCKLAWSFRLLFCHFFSCDILKIQFVSMGINMFWALLKLILTLTCQLRLKWIWVGPKIYLFLGT